MLSVVGQTCPSKLSFENQLYKHVQLMKDVYQTFFIITFKEFVKLLKAAVTMMMNGYDRNFTMFHLCWTKVLATHLYPHTYMAYYSFYERPSQYQLVHELLLLI